jgi:hypothetical protein
MLLKVALGPRRSPCGPAAGSFDGQLARQGDVREKGPHTLSLSRRKLTAFEPADPMYSGSLSLWELVNPGAHSAHHTNPRLSLTRKNSHRRETVVPAFADRGSMFPRHHLPIHNARMLGRFAHPELYRSQPVPNFGVLLFGAVRKGGKPTSGSRAMTTQPEIIKNRDYFRFAHHTPATSNVWHQDRGWAQMQPPRCLYLYDAE